MLPVLACEEQDSASELRLEELSLEAAKPLKRKSEMPLYANEQEKQGSTTIAT